MRRMPTEGQANGFLILLLIFVPKINCQCGPRCGYVQPYAAQRQGYAQPFPQPLPQPVPQPLLQPLPQPMWQPTTSDYLYKTNTLQSYPPEPSDALESVDKETPSVSVPPKASDGYDDVDKKIAELKSALPEEPYGTKEVQTIAPASTYIRETPVYQPYHPHPFVPRPPSYRPQPIPEGCPPVVPPYYRPAPYMPRGYVMPYSPLPTYAPPPPPPPPPPQPLHPYAQPVSPGYQAPINDCCGRCASVCGHGARRVLAKSAKNRVTALGAKIATSGDEAEDRRCTSKELREIMDKVGTNVSYRTLSLAKRLIQRIAEEKLGGYISVFCSKDDFTYVSRGGIYCQTESNGVICYAFQHH